MSEDLERSSIQKHFGPKEPDDKDIQDMENELFAKTPTTLDKPSMSIGNKGTLLKEMKEMKDRIKSLERATKRLADMNMFRFWVSSLRKL